MSDDRPIQAHKCPACDGSIFLPKTPRDIVERLGAQQGARVAASLRGDRITQAAAEKWLAILASDQWHNIISDLSAMYAIRNSAPAPRENEPKSGEISDDDQREECDKIIREQTAKWGW